MTDTTARRSYLETARKAAAAGAAVLDDAFRSDEFEVERKTPTDLVTEIDRRAERAIADRIAAEYPDHALYAEESGLRGSSSYRWLVDPLDGTTDYVNGSTYHCVSVALAIEGRPVVGVVDRPATGDRYAAVAGEGATRNGEPIGVSSTADLGDAYLGTGISPPAATDEHYRALYDYCIREGNTQGVRQRGSAALDLCRVARGTFDGFFDMYTSPWDVAAGAFVLTEAGGRVTDYGGEPLDYSADERMIHVVGTNGQLHDRFLELAEALAPETG